MERLDEKTKGARFHTLKSPVTLSLVFFVLFGKMLLLGNARSQGAVSMTPRVIYYLSVIIKLIYLNCIPLNHVVVFLCKWCCKDFFQSVLVLKSINKWTEIMHFNNDDTWSLQCFRWYPIHCFFAGTDPVLTLGVRSVPSPIPTKRKWN